jgi:toxin CptA
LFLLAELNTGHLIDASMHSAPAVSFPVGRSRFQGWLVGSIGLAGMITGLLWHHQSDTAGWRLWLYSIGLVGTCVAAAEAWRRSPRGSLRWDGQTWCWTGHGRSATGVLTVHLDFQFGLLLSLRPETGARIWLWPERRAEVALWKALRRAAFARGAAIPAQDAHAAARAAHR